MKKLKVLGLAAVAAGMVTLTSCLDGGGNTQSGGAFGYADFNMEPVVLSLRMIMEQLLLPMLLILN